MGKRSAEEAFGKEQSSNPGTWDLKKATADEIISERFRQVKKIRAHNMLIDELPPEITSKCTALEKLQVSHCLLKSMPRGWECLTNLKELDFSGNRISEFNPHSIALRNFPHLDKIYLSGNDLRCFPSGIFWAPKLREADLSNCGIETLPCFSEYPHGLDGPDADGKPSSPIEAMDLSGNPFKNNADPISDLLCAAPKMKILEMANCGIKKIPPGRMLRGHSASIEVLDLSENRIKELPDEEPGSTFPDYRYLAKVKRLNLSGNNLKRIPENFIRRMPNLTHLNVARNAEDEDAEAMKSAISSFLEERNIDVKW